MARYNHYAPKKYKTICFNDVPIKGKFRRDFMAGGRRRTDIICIRTGTFEYIEERSKMPHSYFLNADLTQIMVSSFSERIQNSK